MSSKLKVLPIVLIASFLIVSILPLSQGAADDPTVSVPADNIDRVILISIDSVGTMLEKPQNENFVLTPNLKRLKDNGVYFKGARDVLPAVTQVNHLVMATGAYPEKIGISGNTVWDRKSKTLKSPWKNPKLIKAQTIFEAMEEINENYTTAIVAGKNYVGCPMWADIQVAPACIHERTEVEFGFHRFPEPIVTDAPASWIMDKALEVIDREDPEMMLLHLDMLDHVRHYSGPDSLESWAQLSWEDHQIGRLIKYLRDSGKLKSTLLIVTADHGQVSLWKNVNIEKLLEDKGIEARTPNPDGTFAHVFLEDPDKVDEAVRILREQDYVRKVWAGDQIDDVNLKTPYTGDILVNLKLPYKYSFSYGPLEVSPGQRGNHGGLPTSSVFMIFFGPHVKRGVEYSGENVCLVDIVPTIHDLTGLPLPKDSQGRSLENMVENLANGTAPIIDSKLMDEEVDRVGLIPLIYLVIAAVFLVAGVWPNWKVLMLKVEGFGFGSWLKTSLPLVMAIATSLITAFFIHIQNLITDAPGINPDAYIGWMAAIGPIAPLSVLIPVVMVSLWFSHWGIGGLIMGFISRLTTGKSFKRSLSLPPLMFVPLAVSQIVYVVINIVHRIPPIGMMCLYLILFWLGFALSVYLGILLNRKIYETSWVRGSVPVIVFGALTAAVWVVVLASLLFVNIMPGALVSF